MLSLLDLFDDTLIQEFLDGLKINGRGNYVEEIYGFISTAIFISANSIITRYLGTLDFRDSQRHSIEFYSDMIGCIQ